MSDTLKLNYDDVHDRAKSLALRITNYFRQYSIALPDGLKVYGVPRGGVPVAYALARHMSLRIVDRPEDANCFVDDIIDSGVTRNRYHDLYYDVPFFALIDKTAGMCANQWVIFPWEKEGEHEETIEDNIRRIIQHVGEDTKRPGLIETPHRVAKAWQHWCSGYDVDIPSLLKVFEDGADGYDQMVLVKDIPIYSKCEHHLADIFGTCSIAYIPNGKIVGLSKLSRVADAFARRLQVQERLTNQIAEALYTHLEPKGVGVIVKARHLCMESRGICQQGHHTITSALRGVFNDAAVRAEFLQLAK